LAGRLRLDVRSGYLLPSAVIERDRQRQAAVVAGQLFGLDQQCGDVVGEPFAAADHPHAHVVGVQFRQIVADEAFEQPHQQRDLVGRPAPVFGREAVERQKRDADFARRAHRAAHGFDSAAMALVARQAARLRPAAVAVHYDGDVARRLAGRMAVFDHGRHGAHGPRGYVG